MRGGSRIMRGSTDYAAEDSHQRAARPRPQRWAGQVPVTRAPGTGRVQIQPAKSSGSAGPRGWAGRRRGGRELPEYPPRGAWREMGLRPRG